MDNDKSIEDIGQENAHEPNLRGYKSVCAKLGLSMCVYYTFRVLAGLTSAFFPAVAGGLGRTAYSLLYYTVIIVMTYVFPLALTVTIFKYNPPMRSLYKKPRRVARALGTFPAAYGLGYGVALLTLLVSFVLSETLGGETRIENLLRPATIEATTNVAEFVMMTVMLIVVAPVFEEYWVRGIFFDSLRPYGAGMAILISSFLFGLMHGSLYMLFYTTAFGLALGYIRYATGSLFAVTILHALVNSISAIMLLLLSLGDMAGGQNKVLNTIEMIYVVIVLIFIIAGVAVFLAKIPVIRKYRFENPWTEIGPWKKIGVFFASIPVLFMLVLAINELSGQLLVDLIT